MKNVRAREPKKAKSKLTYTAFFLDDSMGLALTPLRNCGDESQRDSDSKPKVARNELPWGMWRKTNNPNGVAAHRLKPDATPLELKTIGPGTQGSSFLATLGWKTQSLWDCRTVRLPSVPPEFAFERNFRKALALAGRFHDCFCGERRSKGRDGALRRSRHVQRWNTPCPGPRIHHMVKR